MGRGSLAVVGPIDSFGCLCMHAQFDHIGMLICMLSAPTGAVQLGSNMKIHFIRSNSVYVRAFPLTGDAAFFWMHCARPECALVQFVIYIWYINIMHNRSHEPIFRRVSYCTSERMLFEENMFIRSTSS